MPKIDRPLIAVLASLLAVSSGAQDVDLSAINAGCKDPNLQVDVWGFRFVSETDIEGMTETIMRHFERL